MSAYDFGDAPEQSDGGQELPRSKLSRQQGRGRLEDHVGGKENEDDG